MGIKEATRLKRNRTIVKMRKIKEFILKITIVNKLFPRETNRKRSNYDSLKRLSSQYLDKNMRKTLKKKQRGITGYIIFQNNKKRGIDKHVTIFIN